ncbi:hypothetical protein HQN87_28115 [Paenibacillus tritici]|uniref:Uncharacterized protein n=1 Tax=Paenibacillus tritici TaxID=1873425 RepID=A0ABX2DWV6_9BACL|nr:hypothetical protein [Paenibacillus tritici]NQX49194.1 hypothetical protein [Paenibacillus tritici]
MFSKKIKQVTGVLMAGFLIGVTATLASAAPLRGPFINTPTYVVNNQYYRYTAWSEIDRTAANNMKSQTYINNQVEWEAVPAGYIGAQTALYKDGALVASSSPSYTDFPTYAHVATEINTYGYGNYSAKGVVYVYKGNGYDSFITNQTPAMAGGF